MFAWGCVAGEAILCYMGRGAASNSVLGEALGVWDQLPTPGSPAQ